MKKYFLYQSIMTIFIISTETTPANAMFRRGALLVEEFAKGIENSYVARRSYSILQPKPVRETNGYTPSQSSLESLNKQATKKLPDNEDVAFIDKNRERFVKRERRDNIIEEGDTVILKFEKKK